MQTTCPPLCCCPGQPIASHPQLLSISARFENFGNACDQIGDVANKVPQIFRLPTPRICNDAGNMSVAAKKLNFHPKLANALVASLFLGLAPSNGSLPNDVEALGNPAFLNHQWQNGLLAGYEVARDFSPQTGDLDIKLKKGTELVHEVRYRRDSSGRINAVNATGLSTTYSNFIAGTRLFQSFNRGGGIQTAISYDNDLRFLSSTTNSDRIRQFAVTAYTAHDQIESLSTALGDWSFTYDNNGQLTNAALQLAGTGRVENFHYNYDSLGSRTHATLPALTRNPHSSNGGGGGMFLRAAVSYGAGGNSFNQQTAANVSTALLYLQGRVNPDEDVVVEMAMDDGQREPVAVSEEGTFFHPLPPELALANAPVVVSVFATIAGGGANGTDAVAREDMVVAPRLTGTFGYDSRGNLTSNGEWSYKWNARDRLAEMERTQAWVAAGNPYEIAEFSYDAAGRRVSKHYQRDGQRIARRIATGEIEYLPWDHAVDTSVHQVIREVVPKDEYYRYVWEGGNMLSEELSDGFGNVIRELFFVWGVDVSKTRQGAGGVGGLSAIRLREGNQQWVLAPIDDGRGNIVALADADTGATLAEFAYGPFGEPLVVSGARRWLEACPFRFGSKYTDAQTGLIYFGYRYYDPMSGRWLSREPLGEAESVNLYAYCHNDPVNKYDYLGLAEGWTFVKQSGADIRRRAKPGLTVYDIDGNGISKSDLDGFYAQLPPEVQELFDGPRWELGAGEYYGALANLYMGNTTELAQFPLTAEEEKRGREAARKAYTAERWRKWYINIPRGALRSISPVHIQQSFREEDPTAPWIFDMNPAAAVKDPEGFGALMAWSYIGWKLSQPTKSKPQANWADEVYKLRNRQLWENLFEEWPDVRSGSRGYWTPTKKFEGAIDFWTGDFRSAVSGTPEAYCFNLPVRGAHGWAPGACGMPRAAQLLYEGSYKGPYIATRGGLQGYPGEAVSFRSNCSYCLEIFELNPTTLVRSGPPPNVPRFLDPNTTYRFTSSPFNSQ